MDAMRQQAVRFGTQVVSENITSVDFARHPFVLTPGQSGAVQALSAIIATGARANWLGLHNEERLARTGGGVSACAVCDGALPYFRDKVLAVVGGGDSAMEEATYLTKYAREVIIIHRRNELRASKTMAERALTNPKIRVEWNTRILDVLGGDFVTGLHVVDTVTGAERQIEVGGLFIAIGHTPNTDFVKGKIDLHPTGYIVTPSAWRTCTSVPGVFAAGDVMDSYYRQAVTAAGMGCMAALEAERWLSHQGLAEAQPPVLETAEAPTMIELN
jgi:thioredoxin reductase (NADPH)